MLLFLLFLYSFALTITLPVLFPTLKLIYFSPFLVFALYRSSKTTCLWLALLCGIIFDLFSAQMRFGIYALNYALTTYFLFNIKNYFFKDSLTTLPIVSLLFVYTSTFIQLILIYTLSSGSILSWGWFKTELIEMPFYSLLYSILAFGPIPFLFPEQTKKTSLLVKFKDKL